MTEWNGHFMKWLKYPAITWNGWYHTLTVTYIAYSSLCARSTMYRPMQRRGKRGSRGTCPQTLTEVGQCLPTLARLKCCIFYKKFPESSHQRPPTGIRNSECTKFVLRRPGFRPGPFWRAHNSKITSVHCDLWTFDFRSLSWCSIL